MTPDSVQTFLSIVAATNDETRLRLLRFIQRYGPVCVCDVEHAFAMIQSRISRHLKILKEAGFLKVDRRGRWSYYALAPSMTPLHRQLLEAIETLELAVPDLPTRCNAS